MNKSIILLSIAAISCGKKDDRKPAPSADEVKKSCFTRGFTYDQASNTCGKSGTYGLISNDSEVMTCKGYSDIDNFGKYCNIGSKVILEEQPNEKTVTLEYSLFVEASEAYQIPKTDDPAESLRMPNLVVISEDNGIERTLTQSPWIDRKLGKSILTIKGKGPFKIIDTNSPIYTKGYWLDPQSTLTISSVKAD